MPTPAAFAVIDGPPFVPEPTFEVTHALPGWNEASNRLVEELASKSTVGITPELEELDEAEDDADVDELELDALLDELEAAVDEADELPELEALELDAVELPPPPPPELELELDGPDPPPMPLELESPIQPPLDEDDDEVTSGFGLLPAAQLAAAMPVEAPKTVTKSGEARLSRRRRRITMTLLPHAPEREPTMAS
jgi:hypothetical protein